MHYMRAVLNSPSYFLREYVMSGKLTPPLTTPEKSECENPNSLTLLGAKGSL